MDRRYSILNDYLYEENISTFYIADKHDPILAQLNFRVGSFGGDFHKDLPKLEKFIVVKDVTKNVFESHRDFSHNNIVKAFNYNERTQKMIIEHVDCSFEQYIHLSGDNLFVEDTTHAYHLPSAIFRRIIRNLCTIVDYLSGKKQRYRLSMDKVMVCLTKSGPVIKLIGLEGGDMKSHSGKYDWRPIAAFIDKTYLVAKRVLPPSVFKNFKSYLLLGGSLASILGHPYFLNDEEKRAYFILMEDIKNNRLDRILNAANIGWPQCYEVNEIVRIMNNQGTIKPYDMSVPSEFIRFCRNSIKHYRDLPRTLGDDRFHRDEFHFLNCVQTWSPDLLSAIYAEIGPLNAVNSSKGGLQIKGTTKLVK